VSDEVSGYPGAPPGWYPDPAGGSGERWWDGYAWTEATVQAEPPPVAPPVSASAPAPPPPPAWSQPPDLSSVPTPWQAGYPPWTPPRPSAVDLVTREAAIAPRARLAAGFFGVYFLVALVNLQLNRAQLKVQGNQIRAAYDAAQNGKPAPSFSTPSTADPLGLLVGLLAIVALIVALIWQYRAASSARALGFTATHSPGWGVGCWFVPIVNLWMPYQAIRDCLPPGDPHRPLVLRWWLVALGAEVLTVSASFAAFFSSSVALGISLPAALFGLGVIATAPRVVVAVSTTHRIALDRPGQG